MKTAVINIIARVGGEGLAGVHGYSMCTHVHTQTLDKAGHYTIAHLSGLNACIIIVVCNAIAPRVCTLVLFIIML